MQKSEAQVHLRGGGECDVPAITASKSFDTYRDFTQYLASRKCPNCTTLLIKEPKDVQELFQRWASGKSTICSRVKCRKCSKPTCIACFDKASGNPTEINVEGAKLQWCCSRGRMFMIWVVLCGFDLQYSAGKRKDAATTGTGKGTSSDRGRSGVGYATDRLWGLGEDSYSMGGMFGRKTQTQLDPGQKKAQSAEKQVDEFTGMVLSFLATLLPSPDNNTSFDVNPPEAVTSMLLSSKVLNRVAELLRNDSLDNASKRKTLYNALLGLLRNIGTHQIISKKAMFSERMVMPDANNLLTLSFHGAPKGAREEPASSLADLLRNLGIQSNMMMKGAMNNKREFDDQEGRDLLWLCRKISDLSTYVLGKDRNTARAPDCGIIEVPESEISPTYCYYSEAMQRRQSPAGRIKRLITEITNLKTSLSTGIYVKHGSSRLDVMKFVIVGPKGTPYENGLFEFDLWCPAEYPYVPPKVWFKGTGNGIGMVQFNPNLHPDGKVCLSLLGTFEGEPWRPGQSTILQVLVSIQAMIFCEDPVSNEPWQAGGENYWESKSENQRIRGFVAQLAILKWAQDPPKLWRDVANAHFKRNGNKILQTVEHWAKIGPRLGGGMIRMRSPTDITQLLPDLQKALEDYGATYKTSVGGGSSQQPSNTGYKSQNLPARGGGYGGSRRF